MCSTCTLARIAVPGAPINLAYDDLNATICDSATLRWDPPSEDERNGSFLFNNFDF